ncbi:MAG: hypothetical protein P4L77_07710 [Sulfuriferula sp.]|nr:hypothetical protein [Sulfuriferula sp.]
MEIAEIEKIMSLLGSLGLGAIIGALAVYLLLKSFLPSYLSEKGKNLATKEDVASITDKVESVKTDYAKVLEELRSNNQLKLAEIEREKNIKKEVYLQAVEALTRTQNIVGTLSNLNTDEQKITAGMVNDSGLIAKVQIVGSERTVKAVTTIMASIGTAIMELMLERGILVERKNTIEMLEGFRSRAQGEIDRYIAIMKNLNLEGNQDKRLWDSINNSVQFETQQRDKFSQEISDLWKTQNKEHLKFTQKCMNKFFEITSLLPDAVLAVREDLNLTISNDAYLDIFNKNIEQGRKVFGEFFKNISDRQA